MLNLVNNCCTRIAACCRNYGKTPKAGSKPAVNQVAQNALNQENAAIAAAVTLAGPSKASQIAMQLSPYAPSIAAAVGHPAAASAEDVTLRQRKPQPATCQKQEPSIAYWAPPHTTGSNVTTNQAAAAGAGAVPSRGSLREEILSKISVDIKEARPLWGQRSFMEMFNSIDIVEAQSRDNALVRINQLVSHIPGDPIVIEAFEGQRMMMDILKGSEKKLEELKKMDYVFAWKENDLIQYIFTRMMTVGGEDCIGTLESNFSNNLALSFVIKNQEESRRRDEAYARLRESLQNRGAGN